MEVKFNNIIGNDTIMSKKLLGNSVRELDTWPASLFEKIIKNQQSIRLASFGMDDWKWTIKLEK